jgi:large-conductance mechanosensitive channel
MAGAEWVHSLPVLSVIFMNYILFADMIGDTARDFGVDWPHLIAQTISFIIVAGALTFFAYKPILNVLDERRKRIATAWPTRRRSNRNSAEPRPPGRRF